MDEKFRTPIEDEAWKAEIERAQNESKQKVEAKPLDERKSIIKLLAKGIFAGILCLLLLFAWVYADNALLPFDAAAWKANIGREKQIGRLRRQVQLVGMNRQQVVQLLGKPDEASSKKLLYAWSKYMGVGFLVLELENNQVKSQRIAYD